MNRFFYLWFLLGFFTWTASAAEPEGRWIGGIVLPDASELAIQINLEIIEGEWVGTISIPIQGIKDFPLSELSAKEGKVGFLMAGIPGDPRFSGTLDAAAGTIAGDFTQGGQKLAFYLKFSEEDLVLLRPQKPKPPFPYASRDVSFRNEEAGIALAGTLIIPPGEGPFPAVLFVSGSGPQDRDESLMGHQPFWVIADDLARRGIASLRYDDRGVAKSEGDHLGSTVDDFAKDVAAGIAFLAALPEVDSEGIGIIGHSEGGLTGPKVAGLTEDLDYLVLLAPPGVALDQLVARQSNDLLAMQGIPEELVARVVKNQLRDLAAVKDATISVDELRQILQASFAETKASLSEEEQALLQLTDAAVEQNLQMSSTPWFRSLLREEPVRYFETLKFPVLALFAENDLQVAAEENAAEIEAALARAENPDFEVTILPGLNHLFQTSATGAPSEYGTIEETVSPVALKHVGDWIVTRFGK